MSFTYKFVDNSKAILNATTQQQKQVLQMWGDFIEGQAKDRAPVDTGNLRNSITHAEDSTSTTIGSAVSYSVFQELGTSKMPAHPFLRPAIEQNESNLKNIAEKILKT